MAHFADGNSSDLSFPFGRELGHKYRGKKKRENPLFSFLVCRCRYINIIFSLRHRSENHSQLGHHNRVQYLNTLVQTSSQSLSPPPSPPARWGLMEVTRSSLWALVAFAVVLQSARTQTSKPNIVFILADDLVRHNDTFKSRLPIKRLRYYFYYHRIWLEIILSESVLNFFFSTKITVNLFI